MQPRDADAEGKAFVGRYFGAGGQGEGRAAQQRLPGRDDAQVVGEGDGFQRRRGGEEAHALGGLAFRAELDPARAGLGDVEGHVAVVGVVVDQVGQAVVERHEGPGGAGRAGVAQAGLEGAVGFGAEGEVLGGAVGEVVGRRGAVGRGGLEVGGEPAGEGMRPGDLAGGLAREVAGVVAAHAGLQAVGVRGLPVRARPEADGFDGVHPRGRVSDLFVTVAFVRGAEAQREVRARLPVGVRGEFVRREPVALEVATGEAADARAAVRPERRGGGGGVGIAEARREQPAGVLLPFGEAGRGLGPR